MPHVEQELLILSEHLSSPPICSGVRLAPSLVFCVMFCRSLFFCLSFLIWPLYCLSFFDLRILLTPSTLSSLCTFTDPTVLLSKFKLSFIVVMGSFWLTWMCTLLFICFVFLFILFVSICTGLTDPIIKRGRFEIPLTYLALLHLCLYRAMTWRKSVFDIYFTEFGTALTTILPILFQYCYR